MNTTLTANLLILGTIDSLLDQVVIGDSHQQIKDALLSAIVARFISTMLEDASFAAYIREVAPKLQGSTDINTVLKVANDSLATNGKIDVDLVTILLAQAKSVLVEFANQAQSDKTSQELTGFVEAAFAK